MALRNSRTPTAPTRILSFVLTLLFLAPWVAVSEPTEMNLVALLIAERGFLDYRNSKIVQGMLDESVRQDFHPNIISAQPDLGLATVLDESELNDLSHPRRGGIDVVITSWATDAEFALEHLPEVPLINLSALPLKGTNRLTNIGQDFSERVSRSFEWFFDAKRFSGNVVVILGDFPVDSPVAKIIASELKTHELDKNRSTWVTSADPEAILEKTENLSEKDLVVFLPLTHREDGSLFDPVPFSKLLGQTSKAPMMTFWNGLAATSIGGYVAYPELLGREALRALQHYRETGEFPSQYKTSEWYFSYDQLQRFGISMNTIPSGSLIDGAPEVLFSKTALYTIAGLIAAGSVLLLAVWFWGRHQQSVARVLDEHKTRLSEALRLSEQRALELRASQEQIQLAMDMAALEVAEINFQDKTLKESASQEWISLDQWAQRLSISDTQMTSILNLQNFPYVPVEVDAVITGSNGPVDKRFRIMLSEALLKSGVEINYAMIQDITAWRSIRSRAIDAETDKRRLANNLAGVRRDLNSLLDERNRLAEALTHAQKDPLTDLLLRRSWAEFAAIEVDQLLAMRERESALLFLDLDHFKSINDTYGHNVGDLALAHFAKIAGDGLRERDILGRWGGEEFILMLPKTSDEQAVLVAERIRQRLYTTPLNADGSQIKMSVSIGVAAYKRSYSTLESWIDAADKAAYSAKTRGRNKVCLASIEAAD